MHVQLSALQITTGQQVPVGLSGTDQITIRLDQCEKVVPRDTLLACLHRTVGGGVQTLGSDRLLVTFPGPYEAVVLDLLDVTRFLADTLDVESVQVPDMAWFLAGR